MLYIKKFTLSNRFIVNIYDKSEKMRIDSGTDNFYIGSGNDINDAWSEKLPKIIFSNDATTDTVHFTNKVYRKE